MKSSINVRLSGLGLACVLSVVGAEREMWAASTRVDVVAMTGDSAPDGNGSFSELSPRPALNDAGQAAFIANLTNTNGGNTDDSGIFRGDGATLVQIARESQALPGGNGNLGSIQIINGVVGINDSGQVPFAIGLNNTAGGEADDSGMFLGDGTTLVQLVREGQPWPDGSGHFQQSFPSPMFNNAGQVAIHSALSATTVRIFRTDGTMLVEIARDGQDAPDGSGRLFGFGGPAINDAGQVAFSGGVTGPSANGRIFLGDGTTLVQIARNGQASPDGNGRYSILNRMELNDLGQAAFFAAFRITIGGFSDDNGILRADATSLVNIARTGQMAPDGNGAFVSFTRFGIFAPETLNNLGQVAFGAHLTGTTGGNSDDYGIFRSDGATMVQVVREGQAAPDGNGRFSSIFRPALNHAGQVAFRADFTGTSGGTSDNFGVFFFDDVLGLLQVARTGDAYLGSTITYLEFAPPEGAGEEYSGLNKGGVPRVAYFFRLADSREGIAIWTLIPEPASAALVLVATLTMLYQRNIRPIRRSR